MSQGRTPSKPAAPSTSRRRRGARAGLGMLALLLASRAGLAQTWAPVVATPPGAVNLMLLLSDGTVMCCNNNGSTIGNAWYKLTPSATGSYANGTWTTLASMHDTRLYFQTQVLMDGRVYCSGGEYGTGGPKAEVYDPQTNVWTQLTIPPALWVPAVTSNDFYDCNSEILPNGSVLLQPVFPHTSAVGLIYNPALNTWTNSGHLFRGTYQDEATWLKLPDDSILTIDPFGTNTERYIPSTNTWVNDGVVPVTMYDPFGDELGGAVYLPNGKCLFIGSVNNTALYTPSGNTNPGTWVAGPQIPASHGCPDAPCAAMVNGKVLCAVSPMPTSSNHFPPPTSFYEYDYSVGTIGAFTAVNAPVGTSDNVPTYQTMMLDLPDGTVMFSHMKTSVYIYTPAGAPIPQGKPVINTIALNGDGSYHLTGTGLNGIYEGASYGDDWQMNSNYPLVRINHSNGNVYYARTYGWSSTSIATGSRIVSTEYRLPASLPAGAYTVRVIGNGFASDPATGASIGADPQPTSNCDGGSAQFTVTGAGTGPFTYQWRRGTTALSDGGNISGATTATLTINPIGAADLGSDYNCIVSNLFGSATSGNASLSICYANCDCSTSSPELNVLDFSCFLNRYAAGDPYANCDGSTTPPTLNVLDFACFLNMFAAGCP